MKLREGDVFKALDGMTHAVKHIRKNLGGERWLVEYEYYGWPVPTEVSIDKKEKCFIEVDVHDSSSKA